MATAIIFMPSKWLSLITRPLLLFSNSKSKSKSKSKFKFEPRPRNSSTKQEGLLRVFSHFDGDGDGKISGEELGAYFTSIGETSMSQDNIKRVISDFDSNGDNLLEFKDFVRLVEGDASGGGGGGDDDYLRMAFEMFGSDEGGGGITPRGLQTMFNRLGDRETIEECVGMIRVFDLDGNGVVDFHEFKQMMMG